MSSKGHNTPACLAAQWETKALSGFFSRIPFSNLSSWNNHTFNELKQCNYEIGTAILPLRYYNMKIPIKSVMFSLAHFHSLDIFHLFSINPLTMLKGQLEQWVSEHSNDSLHFLFTIPLSLSLWHLLLLTLVS